MYRPSVPKSALKSSTPIILLSLLFFTIDYILYLTSLGLLSLITTLITRRSPRPVHDSATTTLPIRVLLQFLLTTRSCTITLFTIRTSRRIQHGTPRAIPIDQCVDLLCSLALRSLALEAFTASYVVACATFLTLPVLQILREDRVCGFRTVATVARVP